MKAPFQIVVLLLSIYAIVSVFVVEVLRPSIAICRVLDAFDLVVCAVFIAQSAKTA